MDNVMYLKLKKNFSHVFSNCVFLYLRFFPKMKLIKK